MEEIKECKKTGFKTGMKIKKYYFNSELYDS